MMFLARPEIRSTSFQLGKGEHCLLNKLHSLGQNDTDGYLYDIK